GLHVTDEAARTVEGGERGAPPGGAGQVLGPAPGGLAMVVCPRSLPRFELAAQLPCMGYRSAAISSRRRTLVLSPLWVTSNCTICTSKACPRSRRLGSG